MNNPEHISTILDRVLEDAGYEDSDCNLVCKNYEEGECFHCIRNCKKNNTDYFERIEDKRKEEE